MNASAKLNARWAADATRRQAVADRPSVWARLAAQQRKSNTQIAADWAQARAHFTEAGEEFAKAGPSLRELGAELAQAYRDDRFTAQAVYDANGTPHCPHCGGTTFRARRRRGDIGAMVLTLGVAALYVRRDKVECTACRARWNNR